MSDTPNPPAFPADYLSTDPELRGMDLRDYFAAKAMQMKFGESNRSLSLEQMAKVCYEMADAMLAAREAK
jgi:hypothetical protein